MSKFLAALWLLVILANTLALNQKMTEDIGFLLMIQVCCVALGCYLFVHYLVKAIKED